MQNFSPVALSLWPGPGGYTVDPQMGSAAMKGKKQGCVNRSSLEHSMVITLVRSEFELEAIWLLFYG